MDRNLRKGAEELRQRRKERAAAPLHLAAPHRASEDLLAEINGLLRDGEQERADFRHREQALRRQIANVSHDLRTPLTSILGYLQLLESGEVAEAQRREYLAIIENRARVLQGLITSFYDLSRMEAGEYPITRERVDLVRLVVLGFDLHFLKRKLGLFTLDGEHDVRVGELGHVRKLGKVERRQLELQDGLVLDVDVLEGRFDFDFRHDWLLRESPAMRREGWTT